MTTTDDTMADVDKTLVAPADPDLAWSRESTPIRVADHADRYVIGQGDLTTLGVERHVRWRHVVPITALAAVAAATAIVAAVDPLAVRNLVQPPSPEIITTTMITTTTVASPPVTKTETAPPVTQIATVTATVTASLDDQYLSALSRTGWTAKDGVEAAANARAVCIDLIGPPPRTLAGMIRATPEISGSIPPRVWYPIARDTYCPNAG